MLKNKVVLVTGANGALGRVVTEKAIELGARVVAIDIEFSGDFLNSENVTQVAADLLDKDKLADALSGFTAVDVLLNLAGGFSMGPTAYEISDAEWDTQFNINVRTLRNAIHVVTPKILKVGRGAIINVGAMGAVKGLPNLSAYSASKAVVMRLTESLSGELKGKGINVNAVLPSVIDTPANRSAMPDAVISDWVSPNDLAEAICFLASDKAKAIHGALLPVTGLS